MKFDFVYTYRILNQTKSRPDRTNKPDVTASYGTPGFLFSIFKEFSYIIDDHS